MPPKSQSRFWRWTRRVFRWCRIAVWLVVLVAIIAAVWLNRVGLPDFLKDRLVAGLRERGISLRFTRMRLHWYRGLVAENIHLGQPANPNAPHVSAIEADLRLDGRALRSRQVQLKGFGLRGGRMILPVWGTNATPRELAVEKISGELRFSPPDEWELADFRAEVFGVKFHLAGTVTNASAISQLVPSHQGPARARSAEAFWHDFLTRLEASQFDAPTEIVGRIHGDAKVPGSFRASINISSSNMVSPWGQGRGVNATVRLAPARDGAFQADIKVRARDAITEWGRAEALNLEANFAPSFTRWTPTNAHISLAVKGARTPWANAGTLTLAADFAPSPADDTASLAHYTLRAQQVDSKWAKVARLELDSDVVLTSSNLWPTSTKADLKLRGAATELGRAASGTVLGSLELPALEAMEFSNTNVSWWSRLDRVRADLLVKLDAVNTHGLDVKTVSFHADWRAPSLSLRNLHGELSAGEFAGSAALDTQSRQLDVMAKSTIDPHGIAPLLGTNAQKWLAQFTWQKPPLLNTSARVTLPVWTNGSAAFAGADWSQSVLPTFSASGEFAADRATCLGLAMDAVQSSFGFSNLVWSLPNLAITRPEGRVFLGYAEDSRTRAFTLELDSSISPAALGPLLPESTRRILNEFEFHRPPSVRARMSGNWRAPGEVSFHAALAATNLSFRARPVIRVNTVITMTNRLLSFVQPEIERSEGTGRADAVRLDIPKKRIHIDNATGGLDPGDVTHAVSPYVEDLVKPYRFGNPPTGRVWGVVQADDVRGSDLHFDLAGGPFEWSGFRFQQITGYVRWRGETVTISNIHGAFHGGHLQGWAYFDFARPRGGSFALRTEVDAVNMQSLIRDFGNPTNKVEGTLGGLLVITNASPADLKSWQGYGYLNVKDGLLWDFPIFGLFSPLLNGVKPGAGNNKAKEAAATFTVTNSVIHSRDLTIEASGMRLNYDGTVDFDARVDGRMEAQLFRNMPGVGGVLSTVLWPVTKIFEYKIGGTLAKPEAEPLFIPKFLMMPFHPLRTLRELGGEEK